MTLDDIFAEYYREIGEPDPYAGSVVMSDPQAIAREQQFQEANAVPFGAPEQARAREEMNARLADRNVATEEANRLSDARREELGPSSTGRMLGENVHPMMEGVGTQLDGVYSGAVRSANDVAKLVSPGFLSPEYEQELRDDADRAPTAATAGYAGGVIATGGAASAGAKGLAKGAATIATAAPKTTAATAGALGLTTGSATAENDGSYEGRMRAMSAEVDDLQSQYKSVMRERVEARARLTELDNLRTQLSFIRPPARGTAVEQADLLRKLGYYTDPNDNMMGGRNGTMATAIRAFNADLPQRLKDTEREVAKLTEQLDGDSPKTITDRIKALTGEMRAMGTRLGKRDDWRKYRSRTAMDTIADYATPVAAAGGFALGVTPALLRYRAIANQRKAMDGASQGAARAARKLGFDKNGTPRPLGANSRGNVPSGQFAPDAMEAEAAQRAALLDPLFAIRGVRNKPDGSNDELLFNVPGKAPSKAEWTAKGMLGGGLLFAEHMKGKEGAKRDDAYNAFFSPEGTLADLEAGDAANRNANLFNALSKFEAVALPTLGASSALKSIPANISPRGKGAEDLSVVMSTAGSGRQYLNKRAREREQADFKSRAEAAEADLDEALEKVQQLERKRGLLGRLGLPGGAGRQADQKSLPRKNAPQGSSRSDRSNSPLATSEDTPYQSRSNPTSGQVSQASRPPQQRGNYTNSDSAAVRQDLGRRSPTDTFSFSNAGPDDIRDLVAQANPNRARPFNVDDKRLQEILDNTRAKASGDTISIKELMDIMGRQYRFKPGQHRKIMGTTGAAIGTGTALGLSSGDNAFVTPDGPQQVPLPAGPNNTLRGPDGRFVSAQ